MNVTYFVCKKCNKELRGSNKRNAEEKLNRPICADCHFFELIGVQTIAQYNEWLRK